LLRHTYYDKPRKKSEYVKLACFNAGVPGTAVTPEMKSANLRGHVVHIHLGDHPNLQ